MSELRSAVEMLRSECLAELPDARIEEDFSELHRAVEMLEVERLRRLAEIERRRVFARDGHLSAASWLASTYRVGWGSAREQVRIARALEEMPRTRRALEDGEVSLSAVRVLVGAREADPAAFERCESELLEAAGIHSMQNLQRIAAYWRQAVESEQALDDDEKVRARRRLHASVTFLGMVRLDGTLDPETERRSSRRLGPSLTRSPDRAPGRTERRRSAGPTRSVRSAASGWTWASGPRWGVSAPTSR